MAIQVARSPRFPFIVVLLLGFTTPLAGCGLYEEAPQFAGASLQSDSDAERAERDGDSGAGQKCDIASDCPFYENMKASCVERICVYFCEDGFVDRDGEPSSNGCECKVSVEVCDGQDNDCDGLSDNAFRGAVIAVGGAHTCATDASGSVYCWGANNYGQLGIGEEAWRSSPTLLTSYLSPQIDQLGAGEVHTCALSTSSKSLWCWGANAHGQLGDMSTEDRAEPALLALPTPPRRLAVGKSHSCALDTAGTLYCWGDNRAGQLGVSGGESSVTIPTQVASERAFHEVAAGRQHTCGLTVDGAAYCWGDNTRGQLGTGDSNATSGETAPGALPISNDFEAIAAADDSTCGLHTSGAVYCWGAGESVPRPFMDGQGGLVDFLGAQIAVGASAQFCATTPESSLLRCGEVGSAIDPSQSNADQLVALAGGFDHFCAIDVHGAVYCWGNNIAGQLGNGSLGGGSSAPLRASCE